MPTDGAVCKLFVIGLIYRHEFDRDCIMGIKTIVAEDLRSAKAEWFRKSNLEEDRWNEKEQTWDGWPLVCIERKAENRVLVEHLHRPWLEEREREIESMLREGRGRVVVGKEGLRKMLEEARSIASTEENVERIEMLLFEVWERALDFMVAIFYEAFDEEFDDEFGRKMWHWIGDRVFRKMRMYRPMWLEDKEEKADHSKKLEEIRKYIEQVRKSPNAIDIDDENQLRERVAGSFRSNVPSHWPEPIKRIYIEALVKLGGERVLLHHGPAHVVWDDDNFEIAEECLERFDESAAGLEYSKEALEVVRWSLEKLVEIPMEIREQVLD